MLSADVSLASLQAEENLILQSKQAAVQLSLKQVERDIERAGESLRRALPELDVVSRTCADLRGAISKTMNRADVVSARVRELDLARSRALSALKASTSLAEVKQCLAGAAKALSEHDLTSATDFVRRFDAAKSSNEEDLRAMAPLRAELERLVGERLDGMWEGLDQAAAQNDWLDSSVAKKALEHTVLMSKLGPALATTRYLGFVQSLFKERCEFELIAVRALDDRPPPDESLVFLNGLKCILNSCAALIDRHGPTTQAALSLGPGISLKVLETVHSECDVQLQAFLDQYMTSRRLHERASAGPPPDLSGLNKLLVEVCLVVQRIESYDRFICFRTQAWSSGERQLSEHRRLVQEMAGAYVMLERTWVLESMSRAQQQERSVIVVVEERSLSVSSVVEDDFYIALAACKRALATGLCDAACGCVNVCVGAVEDMLATGILKPRIVKADLVHAAVNGAEQAALFCVHMHKFVISSDALERPEDKAKLKSCADGLLDCKAKFEALAESGLAYLFNAQVRAKTSLPTTEMDQLSFVLDDHGFDKDDAFASKLVSVVGATVDRHRILVSSRSFDALIEMVALALAEDLERAVVVKKFSQLGAMKLERDIRTISSGLSALSSSSLRGVFARMLQMTALLSIGVLDEAHDVWDTLRAAKMPLTGSRGKEGLSSKEAKRVLGLRTDFDVKAIAGIKL